MVFPKKRRQNVRGTAGTHDALATRVGYPEHVEVGVRPRSAKRLHERLLQRASDEQCVGTGRGDREADVVLRLGQWRASAASRHSRLRGYRRCSR